MHPGFQVICEIEPPTRPDLTRARHQIGVLTPVADAFLIPDNHIGRATVSSIAVANEVQAMGGRSIACLNSRDRNELGFRRDLLTAAAYGVDRFLFVGGDKPTSGSRAGGLTVRAMIELARAATGRTEFDGIAPFEIGVAGGYGRPLPAWKTEADFVFVQVGFSVERFLRWREDNAVERPVFPGVMVLAGVGMAERLRASVPDIAIPDELVGRVAEDPDAGVEAAVQQVLALRDSGACDGVHLVPVGRYRQVAARLETVLR